VRGRRLLLPADPSLDEPSVSWVLSIKSTSTRGGYIRDVSVSNVDSPASTYVPFEITFQYVGGSGGDNYPIVEGISVRDWRVAQCQIPYRIRAAADAPARNIRIADCAFAKAAQDPVVQFVDRLTVRNVTVG
jgi:hypothetical protein